MARRRFRPPEPRCPVCRGVLPTAEESPERGPKHAPMCSARCKQIDLATWLGEGYRIAGEAAEVSAWHAESDRKGDER
jgi:endogenous inhibitor of DNA gyrase (YacG/DUF329 family)